MRTVLQLGSIALVAACSLAMSCTPKRAGEERRADASPPPASVTPVKPVKLTPFADTRIEAGTSRTGFHVDAFRIRRDDGDVGKTYLEAASLCNEAGRSLCTEAQWLRACDAFPAIGDMPSWTATWKESNPFVRGGGSCEHREKVDGLEKSASRVAFCCERAVGVRAEGDADDSMQRASSLVLRYESALNKGDLDALRAVFAKQVVREQRLLTIDALLEREKESAKSDAVLWTLYDGCTVRPGPVVVDIDPDAGTGRLQGTLIDCHTVVARSSGVVSFRTTLGLARAQGEAGDRIHELRHRGGRLAPGAR